MRWRSKLLHFYKYMSLWLIEKSPGMCRIGFFLNFLGVWFYGRLAHKNDKPLQVIATAFGD